MEYGAYDRQDGHREHFFMDKCNTFFIFLYTAGALNTITERRGTWTAPAQRCLHVFFVISTYINRFLARAERLDGAPQGWMFFLTLGVSYRVVFLSLQHPLCCYSSPLSWYTSWPWLVHSCDQRVGAPNLRLGIVFLFLLLGRRRSGTEKMLLAGR